METMAFQGSCEATNSILMQKCASQTQSNVLPAACWLPLPHVLVQATLTPHFTLRTCRTHFPFFHLFKCVPNNGGELVWKWRAPRGEIVKKGELEGRIWQTFVWYKKVLKTGFVSVSLKVLPCTQRTWIKQEKEERICDDPEVRHYGSMWQDSNHFIHDSGNRGGLTIRETGHKEQVWR